MRKMTSSRYGRRWLFLSTPKKYGFRARTVFSPGTYCAMRHGPLVTILSGGVPTLYAAAYSPFLYASSSTCFGMMRTLATLSTSEAFGDGVLTTTVYGSGAVTSNGLPPIIN